MPAGVGVRRNALKARARGVTVTPRVQVAEMQRARLLSAAVASISELGYARTSVAHITSRAHVSRRTFYDLFENREDCLLAVFHDAVQRIEMEIQASDLAGCEWCDRVRGGLLTILSFFDREPALARVCVVRALQGGPRVLRAREEVLTRLAGVLDEGRGQSARSRDCTVLTAEGLVGAAFAIVHARISSASIGLAGQGEASRSRTQGAWRTTYASDRGRRDAQPLVVLLGELMSLIVLPYQGPAAARREQQRSLPSRSSLEPGVGEDAGSAMVAPDLLRDVPMRLTYRTARVLEVVAERPGASNRLVADGAGITDQGQVSKLLARLERLGLLANTGAGHAKGEPNQWSLTCKGVRVQRSIDTHTDDHERTPA
jgi:AcrR family transcriptional regulator